MATDHRGTPVHAGKRTNDEVHASRLAQLVATQDNNFWRNHGVSHLVSATPESVQQGIDGYRTMRDHFGSDDFQVRAERIYYGNAFKNRHNADYATPSSLPFPDDTN